MHRIDHSQKEALGLRSLRIGYVPLVDAAPLIGAAAWGDYAKAGLDVKLSREIGWGTIREKLVFGELDAVHIPAPMAISIQLGLGCAPMRVVAPWILGWQGNAITLSRDIYVRGGTDAASLRRLLRSSGRSRLTLAVVGRFTMHAILLRRWLAAGGIDPARHVRFVVLPPPQMVRGLAEGLIDGFCAGEPWGSAAVAAGCGWIAATSADVLPAHMEKVLLFREDFASSNAQLISSLLQALKVSAIRCESADGRKDLAILLARPEWLGVPVEVLRQSLTGPLDLGTGAKIDASRFHLFHEPAGHVASTNSIHGLLQLMAEYGQISAEPSDVADQALSTFHSITHQSRTTPKPALHS